MIIITDDPSFDWDDDEQRSSGATIYHGTNNPMTAFRLFMKETFVAGAIDNLSDAQLLDKTFASYTSARYSERYLFTVIPTQEGEITVESVDTEVYIGASIGDLFTGDDDHER